VSKQHVIEGSVAPGYESVKKIFEANFDRGAEENSQLCVYVGEEKVVDLVGRVDPDNGFNADSLINVFSSTKSLTAIMIAMAKDNGLLDYGDKISKHWPEFGEEGKEDITVADLMRHEAGLAHFPTAIELTDILPENLKKNAAGEKIAKMKPSWPENGKRQYHSLTRGWIANEIFRRVQGGQTTLGEFLDRELAKKLSADVNIGCTKDNYYPVKLMEGMVTASIRQTFGLVNAGEVNIFEAAKLMFAMRGLRDKSKPDLLGVKDALDFSMLDCRRSEMPSVNGNCSARGLAKVAAMMANKGTFQGSTFLSLPAWESMHAEPTEGELFPGALEWNEKFTQGGVAKFGGNRTGYYGWFGYGGSAFHWHPELKIGFAYTCTLLYAMTPSNTKSSVIAAEVAKCAKEAKLPAF